jgi:hypothetical protein
MQPIHDPMSVTPSWDAHITKTGTIGTTAKVIWNKMDKKKPEQEEGDTREHRLSDVRVLFARLKL